MKKNAAKPLIGVVMGSASDWETMRHAATTLDDLKLPFEKRVLSAHRTPEASAEYASSAARRGLRVIIAAAGGAAHLAGAMAAHTELPVLGVPMKGWSLDGLDALLSTAQMPSGIPVLTLAIGKAGAVNSALAGAAILALNDKPLRERLKKHRRDQKKKVLATELPGT